MPHNSHEGMSGGYLSTHTSSSSSENEDAIPQNSTYSTNLPKALHGLTPNPGSPVLACPVSGCSLVFDGKMPYGYLWRHLGRPGIHGRTGDEKAAWLDLHKLEHDRLLATHITPAERRREANKAKAQKILRTAEFELRARNMGITEEALVAQKVAIWEGMWAAEQSGEDIELAGPSLNSYLLARSRPKNTILEGITDQKV